jgi:adiponectin receptor
MRFSDVPSFCQCLFINRGYRNGGKLSFQEIAWSLFSFHNESMNIWTHLIGFVVMLYVAFSTSLEVLSSDDETFLDVLVLQFFFFCACICLLLSFVYHWFACVSEEVHENLLMMDLTGVGLLISGSFIPGVWYGFKCVPIARSFHLALSAFIGVVGFSAPWITIEVAGRKLRPFILASLVVLGLVPFSHWLLVTPTSLRAEVIYGFLFMFGE